MGYRSATTVKLTLAAHLFADLSTQIASTQITLENKLWTNTIVDKRRVKGTGATERREGRLSFAPPHGQYMWVKTVLKDPSNTDRFYC